MRIALSPFTKSPPSRVNKIEWFVLFSKSAAVVVYVEIVFFSQTVIHTRTLRYAGVLQKEFSRRRNVF